MSPERRTPTRPAASAARFVVTHWRVYGATAVVLEVGVALLVVPTIALLLRAALTAAGVAALTEASIGRVLASPAAVAILLVLATVSSITVLIQHGAFLLLTREVGSGRHPSPRSLLAPALAAGRRLLVPQLGAFALYAFVLVPLGGFSLGATLTRAIELPPFIAGELQKTPTGTALWLIAILAIIALNVRLILVPALLLTGSATAFGAFGGSWRLTRGRSLQLLLVLGAAFLAFSAIIAALATVAVVLTRLSDAVWPTASPVVAGLSLTLVEVVALVAGGLLVGFVSVVLLKIAGVAPAAAGDSSDADPAPAGKKALPALGAALLVVAAMNTAALASTGTGANTAVVAHRGATYEAVENTLESLEAAVALGADIVELDVLQASDGGLVVVHDTNLRRIAGVNRDVFDMTTPELTATTIRQAGRESTIPTFDAFARRAAELGVPLLVELKRHGHERGDLVGDVVAVLAANGLVADSLVQAFDRATVDEIEERFPEVTTGWVVAFARGRLDAGSADFVTMEQTSYSPAVLAEAHETGVDVFLWTVTDPVRMRNFIRAGVDGIITGYPSRALAQRDAVVADTGTARRLEDSLRALVGW